MIAFAYPPGLLLLLVIPLLVLFARRRTVPRKVVLTAFFLLEQIRKPAPARSLRFFRLRRRQRAGLVILLLACVSLAIAGTSLVPRRTRPEAWLLVVDNIPTAAAALADRRVHDAIRGFLLEASGTFVAGDRLTLLTTSPVPAAATLRGREELEARIRALEPARDFPPLTEALPAVLDLARHSSRVVLLSPRAGEWRRALAKAGKAAARVALPPDLAVVRGNTGITGLRVRPGRGEEGTFDVFLTLLTTDDSLASVPVEATAGGSTLELFGPVPIREGVGTAFAPGVPLPPGSLTVGLRVRGDAFPGDDAATVSPRGELPLSVSLEGDGAAVFEAAIAAHGRYTRVPPGEEDVAIFLGDPPRTPEGPALVVYPALDRLGLTFLGPVEPTGAVLWHPDHGVTAAMPAGTFRPEAVAHFAYADGYENVADVEGVTVVAAGELSGGRIVVWAFNPLEDEFYLKPEFIILLRDSLAWLAGGEGEAGGALGPGLSRAAGEITLPGPAAGLFTREREPRPVDLVPGLLALALLLGAYLALSDALTEEES